MKIGAWHSGMRQGCIKKNVKERATQCTLFNSCVNVIRKSVIIVNCRVVNVYFTQPIFMSLVLNQVSKVNLKLCVTIAGAMTSLLV